MQRDFQQLEWNDRLRDDCRALVRLALAEDLNGQQDVTTVATVSERATGEGQHRHASGRRGCRLPDAGSGD